MHKIKEIHVRIVGIPVLGFILAYVFCPHFPPTLAEIFKSISFTFVFWQGIATIMGYFRKRVSAIQKTYKRLIYTALSTMVYIIVADVILRLIFSQIFSEHILFGSLLQHWSKTFMISAVVILIYEAFYFYQMWYNSNIEAEQLRTQQIYSQLEVLKNQVSPHFLFNSLNTLVTLIHEDQNQAVDYTQKLSEVYRYILKHKDKEVVKLSTEMEFIKSYVYLLKMRFPKNLEVNYNVSEALLDQYIAPLTLQMLVENVIKHNIISKTQPLDVHIYTENGSTLIVKNKLQKKNAEQSSTKTGLENIRKRYQYLSNKSIDIITTNANFLVAIPLINVIEE